MDTSESRSALLTKRFFKHSVLPKSSCLHYLLPERREASVTDRLRHAGTFKLLDLLNTATLLSHIAYQILIKCVCVYLDIFFCIYLSCIVYNCIIALRVIIQPLAAI